VSRHDDAERAVQRRFDRLAVRAPASSAASTFDAEAAAITRDLGRSIRGRADRELTVSAQRDILARVRTSLRASGATIVAEIGDLQAEAHADSVRGLVAFMRTVDGASPAIDSPGSLRAMLASRRRELDSTMREIVNRNLAESIGRVSERLTALRREGATLAQATQAVGEMLEAEAWRMQRIARTEAAAAYNAGQLDGIQTLRRAVPDIHARWVEHVSDSTWQPTDKRTAKDSIALHGQVVIPGGLFVMPNDRSVRSSTWGMTWAYPPNRPNDRAVLMPWRRSWGVPGWVPINGERHWLVRR